MRVDMAQFAALRRENDDLRERVRWLEDALATPLDYPQFLGMSKTEAKVISCIASGQIGASNVRIYAALYASTPSDKMTPDDQIVKVYVSKVRKKIAPYGIKIQNVWGWGYRIDPSTRAAFDALLEQNSKISEAV